MGKILLLAIAIWLLIVVLKRYRGNMEAPPKSAADPEDMVQCANCGVHLPKSDSIFKNNQYYCCAAHSNKPGP